MIVIINLFGPRISRCFLRQSQKSESTSPLSQSSIHSSKIERVSTPIKDKQQPIKQAPESSTSNQLVQPTQLPEYIHSDHMQQPNNQYLNQPPYGNRVPQQNPGPNQFMRPPQAQQMSQSQSGFNNQGQSQHMQPHNSQSSQGAPYQGAQQNMGPGGPGGYRKPNNPPDGQRGNRYPPRGNPGSFGNAPAKSSHALV